MHPQSQHDLLKLLLDLRIAGAIGAVSFINKIPTIKAVAGERKHIIITIYFPFCGIDMF